MGKLEDEALKERTSIGGGGKVARTGATFFDDKRGVDVHAPGGKFFVEYDNGRVELKDLTGGKVPSVQELFGEVDTGTPQGSSTPGDGGAGDQTQFSRGELEEESLQERLGLGVTGDPSRVGTTFFDPGRGVDVQADPGKFFVEFGGGGVEVRDIPEGGEIPTFEELFAGQEAATPVGESTPGTGSTGVEGMKIPGIEGKEVARTGKTIFDEKRGIDVEAEEGHIFVEYADGTVEQRAISNISQPGEARDRINFGASFEELGLNEDGSQKRGEVDNSGLEYIGNEYTAANGEKRVAAEGNAFYQDPQSRTILERPDTGKENALPTTSPSILAARKDVVGMFQAVYGREPTEQEAAYWKGRGDKSGSALIGAMQFAKNQGQTIGGTPGADGGDPVAALNSALNSGQMSDFSAIAATTNAVDLSKSSQLVQKLTNMLNNKPDLPSLRDEYEQELLRSGYHETAAELAQAEKALKQLDADFMSTLEDEEARTVSVGQIRKRQGAQEIAYNRIRRDLQVERDYLASQVSAKQAIVNTMVNLTGQDIANAQAEYQNRFQNAMSLTNLVRQVEQDQLTQLQRQQDAARANVQIMSGLIASGNVKYADLDANTRQQLKSMELQAGLPQGFTQFVGETVKDPDVQFLPAYTDINGNRVQPVATVNPSTGAFEIKNVSQGKVDLPVGAKSGGGSGGKAPTQDQLLVAAKSIVNSELASAAGQDGRVDPSTWNRVRQEWAATSPYGADDFDAAFSGYVNNTYPGWQKNYNFSAE